MAESIPEGAFRFDLSATYNAHTIPRELRRGELLPAQVWGKLVVAQGTLALKLGTPGRDIRIAEGETGVIPPQTRFACADASGPVLFHIEYFHEAKPNDSASLLSQMGSRGRHSA